MPPVRLIEAELPDFGVPSVEPELPRTLYEARFVAFRQIIREAGLDAAIVYADREHGANLAYLTGFDPRFEEALLVVTAGRDPKLLTGPENIGLVGEANIAVTGIVYPPFGLLGQDRSKTPPLAEALADSGIARGMRIGVIGWKYYGCLEAPDPDSWMEAPAFIVDTLRNLAGDDGRVVNAARLLMDSIAGLRATNEIEQLAVFEFAACHTSEAVKRAIFGLSRA